MKKRRAAVNAASRPASTPAPAVPVKLLAVICLLLAAAIVAIYAQTAGHGYVAYDDDQYVYQNHWVKAGLTAANIAWAFTTFFYANWHPLTWMSYMLDFSLWGENPGAQHLVNVAFHLGATLLLFLALVQMTRRPWRAALVAALFALHPLRVESVAWISERKDVLSTFFQMLTLFLYVRYVAKQRLTRYLAVAMAFALGLLAKPMAVTFPLVLLLVDYWPLQRFSWPPERRAARRAILEKLPLLALSAVASVFTFLAQRTYGAVASLAYFPFSARAANAAIAYVAYIAKTLWPADLAVLYPEHNLDASSAFLAALGLAAVTVLAWIWRRKRPYVAVGWLWYLGMLVPVIGLVQVGVQSMADRYTYMPTVGLSLALVWCIADFVEDRRPLRLAAATAALIVMVALIAASYRQTEYWKSSRTLFEHTLAVTRDNHIIENNLGVVLGREGDSKGAMALYKEALAIVPSYSDANSNLAHELLKAGRFAEAEPYLTKALAEDPNLAAAHGDLGVLLAARGQFEEARQQFLRAITLAPEDADNESNLCYALTHLGRPREAIAHCDAALHIDPNHANAKFNLQNAREALK